MKFSRNCAHRLRLAGVFYRTILIIAIAMLGRAAFAQVSTELAVSKTEDFKQIGPGNPIPVTDPFTFSASASPTGYDISSASVTPGASSAIALTNNQGVFSFVSAPFADGAALDAAFPNEDYLFNIQSSTNPSFSATVPMKSDAYPAAPTITNTEWTSNLLQNVLQFDPNQDFTFTWNSANSATADVSLTITDPDGVVVFESTLQSADVAVTMPANSLQSGVLYRGRLTFGNSTRSSTRTATGPVFLRSTYASVTNFTINPVDGPPDIATPKGFTAVAGQPLVYQFLANTITQFDVDLASLPNGLTFDPATGIVSGTPTTDQGNPQPVYTLTNAAGQNGGTISLNVQPPPAGPTFANATSVTGHVGAAFAFRIVTTGASDAVKFSASNLPAGLVIDAATGIISGTVGAATSNAVSVTLTDGSFTLTSSLQLTFVADQVLPVITSARRVRIYPGQPFTYRITANYGPNRVDEPEFQVIGKLPTGLTFDPKTNTISGTFGGNFERDQGPPDQNFLNDTPLVQLAGTNTHGTGTSPLVFLPAPTGTVNLSTRLAVGTGDDVLIGGFIITGNAPESIIMRAIGPSLKANGAPLAGALQDTVIELHDKAGKLVTMNDDWRSTQQQAIKNTGVPPSDDRESAIVGTFQPSNYTAIVRGKNSTTGIGLVELFDLGTVTQDTTSRGKLAQISTRGTVHTGDDVMIGGFIIQGPMTKTLLRAIGPELTTVAGALKDPVLELHNVNGAIIAKNDDWRSSQQQEILATNAAPTDDRESALVATLSAGNYTAVVRGKNNTTGVALVEVYNLQ